MWQGCSFGPGKEKHSPREDEGGDSEAYRVWPEESRIQC